MRRYGDNPLTEKDMSALRETDETRVQRGQRVGNLKDYTLGHRVSIAWDLNDEAKRDLMVKLTVDDDIEIILDSEELMRYLRWA